MNGSWFIPVTSMAVRTILIRKRSEPITGLRESRPRLRLIRPVRTSHLTQGSRLPMYVTERRDSPGNYTLDEWLNDAPDDVESTLFPRSNLDGRHCESVVLVAAPA